MLPGGAVNPEKGTIHPFILHIQNCKNSLVARPPPVDINTISIGLQKRSPFLVKKRIVVLPQDECRM